MKNLPYLYTALLLLSCIACGESSLNASTSDMGYATPGGSQDSGYLRAVLADGMIPLAEDISVEGFLAEHSIPSPLEQCDYALCMEGTLVHDRAVAEERSATLIHLGMGSNINLDDQERTPLNLAVVIDVSGSMDGAGRLDFVKQGLLQMLEELSPGDRLSIVTYNDEATLLVRSQPVENKEWLARTITNLQAGGSTNLYAGMITGYEQVAQHTSSDYLSRVILLSDGLANAGEIDPEIILAQSKVFNNDGIGISTIGVGLNFNQELMKSLSEQGSGNFYFLQDPQRATEVFTEELDCMMTPVAHNLVIRLKLAEGFTLVDTFGLPHSWNETNEMLIEVPTVFASRKGGAMLIRVDYPELTSLLADDLVLDIQYQYESLNQEETHSRHINLTSTVVIPEALVEAQQVYTHAGSLKAMVIWNIASAFKAAAKAYEQDNSQLAIELIRALASYVEETNTVLDDEEIRADRRELISLFAMNLGYYLGDPDCGAEEGYCGYEYYYGYDDYYDCGVPFGCNGTGGIPTPWILAGLGVAFSMLKRRRRQQAPYESNS